MHRFVRTMSYTMRPIGNRQLFIGSIRSKPNSNIGQFVRRSIQDMYHQHVPQNHSSNNSGFYALLSAFFAGISVGIAGFSMSIGNRNAIPFTKNNNDINDDNDDNGDDDKDETIKNADTWI